MEIQTHQDGQAIRVEIQLTLPTISPANPEKACGSCPGCSSRKVYDYSEQRPLKSQQAKNVLQVLRDHPRGITTVELQREPYGVCHPPARIMDLREAGYKVLTLQEPYGVGRYILMTEREAV